MKQSIFLLWTIFFLSSCMPSSQIIESKDPYKEMNKMKLAFASDALSEEKYGILEISQTFTLISTYLYEEMKNERPVISVNVQITTPIRAEELDSVMFLILDNEKIRISSVEYKYKEFVASSNSETTPTTTENKGKNSSNEKTATNNESRTTIIGGTNQLMNRIFFVPENLWVSIANSDKIRYRFYLGKEGFDVKLNLAEIKKLKYFFELAMCKRDAAVPPLLPEGLKKL